MFSPSKAFIDAFVDELAHDYRDMYAQHERDLQIITFSARCPLEIIGNSDTTSNDLNHTAHFTLVGQEIPWGKTLQKGAIAQYA